MLANDAISIFLKNHIPGSNHSLKRVGKKKQVIRKLVGKTIYRPEGCLEIFWLTRVVKGCVTPWRCHIHEKVY
jgi:hypothetical protein